MIVDSSALVAIVYEEPDHDRLLELLDQEPVLGIGTPTLVETCIVLSARLGRDARGAVARMLQEFEIETIAFTERHFGVALDAWLRYGRGRHAANLNYGDCMSYAVARLADRPLLCVGQDFPRTDLAIA
jgi:ribonuclease VapC